jgi:hypothetical protein
MSPMKMAFIVGFLSIIIFPSPSQAAHHSIYTGFAEPEQAFTMNSRDFTFADETESQMVTLTAGDYAVYRYAYVSYDGQPWEQFELSGNALGGEWLNGSVSGEVTFNSTEFGLYQSRLSTQRNFIVIYSCSRDASGWDCHGGWQIWQFNASLSRTTEETIELECEAGNLFGNMQFNSSVISDPPCGQGWIETAPGTPNFYWDSDNPSLPKHRAEFPVTINNGGKYYACVRMASPSLDQDALYAGFSSDDLRRFYPNSSYTYDQSWTWISEVEEDTQRLVFEGLSPGDYTFVIGHAEAGARCDKVVLTTEGNLDCSTDVSCVEEPPGPPLAFPEAEGFGTNTRGAYGEGSEPVICIVDTLGAGSYSTGANRGTFEWCITQNFPRIVVFEVSGVIDYRGENKGTLRIRNPYISIYGQTAPDPGVTIIGTDVIIDTHDVIIQHITVRYGDDTEIIHNRDALSIYTGYNIVVDHCSFSWGTDENVGISDGVHDITISNCIIAEPLVYSWDVYTSGGYVPRRCGHSFGLTADENISIFKNVIAYGYDRNPPLNVESAALFNNMIYKSGPDHGIQIRSTEPDSRISIVSNIVLPTEKWKDGAKADFMGYVRSNTQTGTMVYLHDNICQGYLKNPSSGQWDHIQDEVGLSHETESPVDLSGFSILPSELVEDYLISNSGARPWNRSYHDERIITSISSRMDAEIDSPGPLPAKAYNRGIYDGLQTTAGSMIDGHDWGSDPETIYVNGQEVNLDRNCGDTQEVLGHLNEQMPSGTEAILHPQPLCYHVIIQTTDSGSDESITVSGDGLPTFGIAAGTYYGSDGVGGWPVLEENARPLAFIPGYPSSNPHGDDDADGYTNLEEWLHEQTV